MKIKFEEEAYKSLKMRKEQIDQIIETICEVATGDFKDDIKKNIKPQLNL